MGKDGGKAAFCDNAILHYYPHSPYIVKCGVNLRRGEKIVFRSAMRDLEAAEKWISAAFSVPVKTIVHC